MSPSDLQVRLSNLLPSMFEEIVFDFGASHYIQGMNSAQTTRAIDLVKYAQSTGLFDKLVERYFEATGIDADGSFSARSKRVDSQTVVDVAKDSKDFRRGSIVGSQKRFAVAL